MVLYIPHGSDKTLNRAELLQFALEFISHTVQIKPDLYTDDTPYVSNILTYVATSMLQRIIDHVLSYLIKC